MSEGFEPKPKKFGDIIGVYEKRPVEVPQFQRGYSWLSGHVSTLWDDVVAFHIRSTKKTAEYFLGPIVIQEEDDRIILLDGQQRLATITMLFSVLRDFAYAIAGEEGKLLGRDIQRELIEKKTKGYSLRLNETDADFFQDVVQKYPSVEKKARLRSQQLILGAKAILSASVEEKLQGKTADEQIALIRELKETIESSVAMVAISVKSEDDAYMIFETLNDRGLKLSTPDLLLNFLMSKAGNDAERKEIRNKWNGMLSKMGGKNMDYFFRHMWLSNYGDVKAHGLFREIRTHLESKKLKSITFVDMCDRECDSYVAILEQDKSILGSAYPYVVALARDLQTTSSYPLLLSGICCLEINQFEALTRMITGLVIRYAYLANLNPGKLENEFYALARMLRAMKERKESGDRCLRYAKETLAKLNPDDAQVIAGAKKLYLTKREARYIIESLANSLQSKTREVGVDKANLEHIFPLNPYDTDWKNLDELRPYVWHIGNLTMLGIKLNRKAANRPFAEKVKDYYEKPEITMTQSIATGYKDWDEQAILDRAESLGSAIAKNWPGPK